MKDYIEQAIKTESINWYDPNPRLLHAAMGLVTEVSELSFWTDEKNLAEELGDIMWYVALACDTLEITLQEAEEMAGDFETHPFEPVDDLVFSSGEIMDVMKKSTFYSPDKYDPRKIASHLGRIILIVAEIGEKWGMLFLDEIMAANITKLQKRYPEGFSVKRALNRDVEVELNHY